MEIRETLDRHRKFFDSLKTKDIKYRKELLRKLYTEILEREKEIADAVYADFRKPEFEVVETETRIVLAELRKTIKKIDAWSRPEKVRASLLNFPSCSMILHEAYGTVLVISPWNYPFQLAVLPVIGAVAAGNTAVLKPLG